MAHRKVRSVDFSLLPFQATVAVSRLWLWVWEPFAPLPKQQKIRAFRDKMAAMERDKNELLREMEGASGQKKIDLVNAFEDRYSIKWTPEEIAERNAHREQMRLMHEESETLLGIVRPAGNNTEEAVEGLRGYLTQHPESSAAYSFLGGVYYKRGDWNESITAYMEAERRDGSNDIRSSMTLLHIGDALHAKGDLEAAVTQYQHVIYTSASEPMGAVSLAYLRMGNTLQALGKRSEARAAWKQAARLDKTKVVAKEARQKLKEAGR